MALLGNLTGSSQFFNPGRFYNDIATQSLRFDGGSSNRLEKTPNASNRKVWTWGAWVKRTKIGDERAIWSVGGSAHFALFFHSSTHQLRIWSNSGGASLYTNRVFRDTSAWYHICLTSKNSGNYYELYINGVKETSFATDGRATYPAGNDTEVNSNDVHYIGAWNNGGLQYFDGYLADVNFIDGTCVGDTNGILDELGELKNGVWIPKKYAGSYGTNGYRLEFKQTGVGTASTTTIGADTSGNTNHYTSSGIVASDCAMPDSPENNFCTLNGVAKSAGLTLSQGNLQTNNSNDFALGTFAVNSGKWYYENYINSTNGGFAAVYETDTGVYSTVVDDSGNNPDAYGYYSNGQKISKGSFVNYGSAFTSAGDIIGVALDMDNGAIYFSKNGTWQNSATASEIAAGTTTNAAFTGLSGNIVPKVGHYNNNNPTIVNFGQDDTFAGAISSAGNTDGNGIGAFKYAPPSGFLALCSANLPEPTIGPNSLTQADDYFNTVLYTGNATDDTAIAVDFQPDWTWIKKRSDAQEHVLFDSNRGATKRLFSNLTNAESDSAASLKAFTSTGFTLGTDSNVNDNTETFVAWNWKANGGTATATISESGNNPAAVVQANPTAGFSIITYTGTSGTGSIAHGLGAVPKWIIIKNRGDARNWIVYHGANTSAPETEFLILNTTAATADNVVMFSDTAPTSSVFTIGNAENDGTNEDNDTFVAYVFAEVEGYSKFGSYTGNGSTDGTFVHLGFRPAFIMLKCQDNASSWNILDNKRDPDNTVNEYVLPSSGDAAASLVQADFLSNGIKFRTTNAERNGTRVILYMAFAEAPFKYANAR